MDSLEKKLKKSFNKKISYLKEFFSVIPEEYFIQDYVPQKYLLFRVFSPKIMKFTQNPIKKITRPDH